MSQLPPPRPLGGGGGGGGGFGLAAEMEQQQQPSFPPAGAQPLRANYGLDAEIAGAQPMQQNPMQQNPMQQNPMQQNNMPGMQRPPSLPSLQPLQQPALYQQQQPPLQQPSMMQPQQEQLQPMQQPQMQAPMQQQSYPSQQQQQPMQQQSFPAQQSQQFARPPSQQFLPGPGSGGGAMQQSAQGGQAAGFGTGGGFQPDTSFGMDQQQQLQQQQQQLLLAEAGVMPPVSFPMAPAFFTLDQLPPNERHVKLLPHQANDVIEQLDLQPFDGAPRPRVIDLQDIKEGFRNGTASDKHAYIEQLETSADGGRLQHNARASVLQTKLKQGYNRLEDLMRPTVEPGAQGFVDLSFTADGALLPESSRVWQFSLVPLRAEGVGATGLRSSRAPCLFVARMALFDRANHRFLGNVLGVRPKGTAKKDSVWLFDESTSRVVVRCSCVQPDARTGTRMINDEHVSLYVEFNTSYRLAPEDTAAMPPSEKRAARLVDEVTSCWAMVNFKKCASLGEDTAVSVPLYYGSLYDPQSLDKMYKDRRRADRWGSLFRARERPMFTFRAGPVGLAGQPAPLLPYAYMPTTMLALDDLASLLAAARLTMALQLGRQGTPFRALSDPVLSALPGVLADHHLLVEALLKWRDLTEKLSFTADANCLSPQLLPPVAALVEAFRRVVMDVAPLLHCASVPPRHINNFVEYQGHRLKLVQRFCHVVDPKTNTLAAARHPVEPLSHAGYEYLHRPFNTAELRLCMGDGMLRAGNLLAR